MKQVLKNIKKSLLVLLFVFAGFAINTVIATGEFGDSTAVEITHKTPGGTALGETVTAKYKVTDRQEENFLAYGVKHYKDSAQTSTSLAVGNAAGLGGGGDLVANQFYDQQVNFLEVPVSDKVKVVNWSFTTQYSWRLQTVKALAADYEKHNPGWKVIAGVNGDFFDIKAQRPLPYQTGGASVSNGDYFKSSSGKTIAFTNDGTANSVIGNIRPTRTNYMLLGIYNENNEIVQTFKVEKWNQEPEANQTSLYFANWNQEKEIEDITMPSIGQAFVVENAEKALANNPNDFYGRGQITSLEPKTLTMGEFGIVTNNEEVKSALKLGTKIRVQFEYINEYANITDASGTGNTILYGSDPYLEVEKTSDARHPRTMIGRKADGTIVMAVIDGRNPTLGFYGARHEEMAAIMKHYNVVDAYNMDGGGSSTLIIREGNTFRVTNTPSDGRERTDANAIFVVAYDPELDINLEPNVHGAKLDISVINENNHDVHKLYVGIDGKKFEIRDGSIELKDLKPNNRYVIKIYIEDKEGNQDLIVTQVDLTTSKYAPSLKDISYEFKGNNTNFKIDFDDPHSSIFSAKIYFGNSSRYINYGEASLRNVTEDVFDISKVYIELIVDLKDGNGQKTIIIPTYTSHVYFYFGHINEAKNTNITRIVS